MTALVEALFRVVFSYDCVGEERLPERGAAVVAANHPSYLDPILLSLQARRPIRFMAWDRLFQVPLLGALMRLFGAFPVDTGKGKGREAYERAKRLIEQGEIVGIFPEGRRSQAGWLESRLREGAARLAWETGAPLYPATIAGAFRAWPQSRLLPRPARIKVRYHEPIDTSAWRDEPEEVALPAILEELRRRVERSLLPGVKADFRMNVLYARPSPWLRPHEYLPPLLLAVASFWKTRDLMAALPAYAYLAYLLLDHYFIPPSRLAKWLRNSSPILFLLAYGPRALELCGAPAVTAPRALAAIVIGALYPYLYERGTTALTFVKGAAAAFCLSLGVSVFWPSPIGLHVCLPLYGAAFAWERRTVFWRWSTPILLSYTVAVPYWLGPPQNLLPQALAGLCAWLLTRIFPYREPHPDSDDAFEGLGLLH